MRNFRLLTILSILGFILTFSGSALANVVIGYFPSWAENANNIDYKNVTHINYSFALPTSAGGLEPIEKPQMLRTIVQQGHANNVKVLIAIGGWNIGDGGGNDSRFVQLASSPATRTTFVNNVMAFVAEYNLDGVDIDWEYPSTTAESNDFTALMTELNTALKAQGKLLTAAVVAQGYTADFISKAALDQMDYLNIMAYDGGNGADHSPYSYAVSALNYWLGRGLPASKAIVGVPFYSRPGWKSYSQLLAAGADPMADEFNGDYYNGIPTIQKKSQLGITQGGGVMIWELSHDVQGPNSLLAAIAEIVLTPPCEANCVPSLSITAPGAEVSMGALGAVEMTATATDSDGTISSVVFDVDGQSFVGTAAGDMYSASWTPSAFGQFTLTVTATDNSGLTTVATQNVNVTSCSGTPWDSSAVYVGGDEVVYEGGLYKAGWWNQGATPTAGGPWTYVKACGGGTDPVSSITASITAPTSGTKLQKGSDIAISANVAVENTTVSQVEFFNNGVSLGVVTAAPYSYTITNAAVGNYSITVTATAADGKTSTSAAVSVIVEDQIVVGGCDGIAAWSATTTYLGGDQAVDAGGLYKAKWWTYGNKPSQSTGGGQPWEFVKTCN